MKKDLILTIDQGTTSSRSLLIDHTASIVASAQKEFVQHFPKDGWVEHDPEDIWRSQLTTIQEVLQKVPGAEQRVAAAGITNQRETTIVWNRHTGHPVYNAIVWQDRRTAPYCRELSDSGKEALIHRKTGLIVDAYFSATKIRWILENVDNAKRDAWNGDLIFGTIDTWLIWKLTGGRIHATDVSNASRTMLFNLSSLEWDPELLELFNIPRSMMPEVKDSADDFGEIEIGVAGINIPLTAAIGDQQAALFGQRCFEAGMMKNTYGTGCFLVMNTGDTPVFSRHQLLTTIAWKMGTQVMYALEGSVFIGGAVVQWLRDGLGIIQSSSEINNLLDSVPDNGGIYFVPALTGLGAPYWDSSARGMIIGIQRGTTSGHIARAAVESIAFQVFDLVEAMSRDLGRPAGKLRVDGGATANTYLMQFQADLLGDRVERPAMTESTALGAAFMAGLYVNFWSNKEDLAALELNYDYFTPSSDRTWVKQKLKRWRQAVERSLNWANG